MISLRRKSPVREPLDEETKAWYREVVVVDTPLSAQYPGLVEPERKSRFHVMQCQHCLGVHAEACPRVKSREQYENGQLKRVDYFAEGEWTSDSVIWAEDIFG